MTNFKELLTAQRDALTKDIEGFDKEIKDLDILLDRHKKAKSLAVKELKSIEKKLAKL